MDSIYLNGTFFINGYEIKTALMTEITDRLDYAVIILMILLAVAGIDLLRRLFTKN